MASSGHDYHPDMDRGWAWVVAFALASYNILMGGTLKSYGLLYVEFIHWFPEGPAAVGLISLVFGISGIIMAPVGGRLSDSISPRKLIFAAGIVLSTGFAATSLAPNLVTAIMTYGVLAGGSIGMIDGPILSYLGRYFRDKRNLASGIVWMGSSFGNLALAPLFSFLISEYGIRGTLLLLGGLWTHTCIIALLLRSPRLTKVVVIIDDDEKENFEMENGKISRNVSEGLYSEENIQIPPSNKDKALIENDMQNGNQIAHDISKKLIHDISDISRNVTKEDDAATRQYDQNVLRCDNSIQTGKLVQQNGQSNTQSVTNNGNINNLPNDLGKDFDQKDNDIKLTPMIIEQNTQVYKLENEINANTNLLSKSSVTDEQHSGTRKFQLSESPQKVHTKESPSKSAIKEKGTYLNFICNVNLWRVLLTLGCGFYGYYTPIICIPAWGEELGLTFFQVTVLVSVIGGVEMVSRVALGFLADRGWVPLSTLLTVSFIIMGIAGQCVVLVPSFPSLTTYMVLHGIFGGAAHVLMAGLLYTTTSVHWFGSATGLAVVQLHISGAIASTTGGVMKELTGSYSHIIRVSSGIYLLGVLIFNASVLIRKFRSRLGQGKKTKSRQSWSMSNYKMWQGQTTRIVENRT